MEQEKDLDPDERARLDFESRWGKSNESLTSEDFIQMDMDSYLAQARENDPNVPFDSASAIEYLTKVTNHRQFLASQMTPAYKAKWLEILRNKLDIEKKLSDEEWGQLIYLKQSFVSYSKK